MLMVNGGASSPAQRPAPAALSYRREREGASLTQGKKIRPEIIGVSYLSGFHIDVRVNRTLMTRIERIDADLFRFYPR